MKKLLFLILMTCLYFGSFAQSVTDTVKTNVSDPDGTITSVKIQLLSGPPSVTIAAPVQSSTAVSVIMTYTEVGVYVFQLSGTDNEGAVSQVQFQRTIVKNKAPIIDFVPDKTLRIK